MTTSGQAGALIAGRYRLERLTGGGTWPEEIWQGFDEVLNRPVMMRLLPLEDAVEPDLDEQVQSVVAQVARLGHPNIAQVYDVGHEDALRYVVSEWTGGRTLGQIMATGRQRWQRAADWGQQIAEALGALHAIGLVDGVLGPETVSVLDDRRVKLTDVGLGVPQDATATRRPAPGDGAEEPTQLFRPDGADTAGGADDATRVVWPQPGAEDEDATRLVPPPGDDADEATRLLGPSDSGDEATRLVPAAGSGAEPTQVVPGGGRGAVPEGASNDVYALGAILWTAIVGVPPQVGPGDVQGPDVAPLRETGAPAALARLLKSMLAASAAVRPTASAAAGGFAGLAIEARESRDTSPTAVGTQPTQRTGAPPPPPPSARRYQGEEPDEPGHRGRTTGIVIGVIVLLAIAGVAIGLVLANRNSNNPGPVATVTGVPSTGSVTFPENPASSSAAASATTTSAAPSSASAPSTTSAPHTSSAPPTSASPSQSATTPSAPSSPSAPPSSSAPPPTTVSPG